MRWHTEPQALLLRRVHTVAMYFLGGGISDVRMSKSSLASEILTNLSISLEADKERPGAMPSLQGCPKHDTHCTLTTTPFTFDRHQQIVETTRSKQRKMVMLSQVSNLDRSK